MASRFQCSSEGPEISVIAVNFQLIWNAKTLVLIMNDAMATRQITSRVRVKASRPKAKALICHVLL